MTMTKAQIKRGIVTVAVILFSLSAGNWIASGANAQQEDKPAEQVNKNIQVLEGLPNSQLLPVMHLMRTSLGVRCDYCHVAENGKYWMDDKPAKQTPGE